MDEVNTQKTGTQKSKENVPIKDEYLNGQPFSLKSRIGVAIVFSLFGDRNTVA